MFSFSFGKKKTAEVAPDPAVHIQNLGSQLTDDSAVLNETLRELCTLLSTATPYLQEKVDLALGAVVSRHASRLLPTVWTVLLQQIRETVEPKAQLRILKHFSGVASRIASPQRPSAFAAFAKEIMLLLGSPDVVGDRAFVPTFADIITPLGTHAQAEFCTSLQEKALNGVVGWTRVDSRRSAASIVALLIRYTRHCGTYKDALGQVQAREPFVRALVVDAMIPIMIEHAKLLCSRPEEYPSFIAMRDHVNAWIVSLVSSETVSATLETSLLSSVSRSFERLVEFMPSEAVAHGAETMRTILKGVLKLVPEPGLKKVLRAPLLRLSSVVIVTEMEETGLLHSMLSLLRQYALDEDSTLRAESWNGLFQYVRANVLRLRTVDPTSMNSELERYLQFFMDQHQEKFRENCNVTIKSMLRFLKDFAPFCFEVTDSEQLKRDIATTMEYVFRVHSDRGSKLNLTSSIQTGLLEVLERASMGVSNVYLLNYTLDCVLDTDPKVREKGISTLLALSATCPIEDEELRKTQHYDLMAYIEGMESASSSWKPQSLCHEEASVDFVRRNYCGILQFAYRSMIGLGFVTEKASLEKLRALSVLVRRVLSKSADLAASQLFTNLTVELGLLYSDILQGSGALPADFVAEGLETMAQCLEAIDPDVVLGDVGDGFTHKSLFSCCWGVLCTCAAAIDPVAMPRLPIDPALYVSYEHPIPPQNSLNKMVETIAQSAQTGSQDQFLSILDSGLRILGTLFVLGRHSNILKRHMKQQIKAVLMICDITAAVGPNRTLEVVQKIFTALHLDEKAEDSSILLSSADGWTDPIAFLKRCIPVLNRVIMFDLSRIGESLFKFLFFLLSIDQKTNDTKLYNALDENKALFRRIHQIVLDPSYYNPVWGPGIPLGFTHVIALIATSEHRHSLFQAEAHPNLQETLDKLVEVSAAAARSYQADNFLGIHIPLASLTPSVAETVRWSDALVWNDQQWAVAKGCVLHPLEREAKESLADTLLVLLEASESNAAGAGNRLSYHAIDLCQNLVVQTDSDDYLVDRLDEQLRKSSAFDEGQLSVSLFKGLGLSIVHFRRFAPLLLTTVLKAATGEIATNSSRYDPLIDHVSDILLQVQGGSPWESTEEFDLPIPSTCKALHHPLLSLLLSLPTIRWQGSWVEFIRDICSDEGDQSVLPAALARCVAQEGSLPLQLAGIPQVWRAFFEDGSGLPPFPDLSPSTETADLLPSFIDAIIEASDSIWTTLAAKEAASLIFSAFGRSVPATVEVISRAHSCTRDFSLPFTEAQRKALSNLAFWLERLDSRLEIPAADEKPSTFEAVCKLLPYRGSMMLPLLEHLHEDQINIDDVHRMCYHFNTSAEAHRLLLLVVHRTAQCTAGVDTEEKLEWPALRRCIAAIHALARRLITSNLSVYLSAEECHTFLTSMVSTLQLCRLEFDDEMHAALRLSVLHLVIGTSPSDLHWQRLADGSLRDFDPEAFSKYGDSRSAFLELLALCALRRSEASRCKDRPEFLYRSVASVLLFSRYSHSSLEGSIAWHIVRCVPLSVVRLMLADDSLIQLTDPECVRFFSKMVQSIGICKDLLMELHARYTPLLMRFSQQGELDSDQKRAILWYFSSLLIQTVVSEERHTKAKVHYGVMDGLNLYADYPLVQLSLPTAQKVRTLIDQHLMADFHRSFLFGHPSTRLWNSHTHAYLLPVREPLRLNKKEAEKTFSSILQMYIHTVVSAFSSLDTQSPQSFTDILCSIQVVSWLNAPVFKFSPHENSTIATTILQLLYAFYKNNLAQVMVTASGNDSSTLVGPSCLPLSSSKLDWHDTNACNVLVTSVISLFSKGHELLSGAVDVTFLMEKMLMMDIFTNQAAHAAGLVMSTTTTKKDMGRVARIFMHRLGTDIARLTSAQLSMSPCLIQSLRTAFAFISAGLEESVVMKACEVLWNNIVWKQCGGRRIQHYTHFLLQSIVHMQVVSDTQWNILRAIVTLPNSNAPKAVELSSLDKAVESFAEKASLVQRQLNKLMGDDAAEAPKAVTLEGVRGEGLLEGNNAANRTYATTANLLHLTTLSAFTLRSKTNHRASEEETDVSRVDALDMLRQVAEEPTAVGEVFLQVVYTIVGKVLEPNDLLFVVLNRFNYSTSALVLFSTHLQRLVRVPSSAQLSLLMSQLSLFFDAAVRREQTLADSWWTAATLLGALYAFVNQPEAAALSKCLCGRLHERPLKAICWYLWASLRKCGRTKDTNILLRSMEASLRAAPNADAKQVVQTLRSWVDSHPPVKPTASQPQPAESAAVVAAPADKESHQSHVDPLAHLPVVEDTPQT